MGAGAGRYVVAAVHPWNRRIFQEWVRAVPGEWHFIGERAELTTERLEALDPAFVFFLHWSWKVPEALLERFTCVNFHMTDLPYGRGGSPLQNLIVRGHRETVLTAIRMTEEMDAGPVYAKRTLSLEGTAQEVYERASRLALEVAGQLAAHPVEPVPQEGEPVLFQRRTPAQSALPEGLSPQAAYDFIRMLDAEGYPRAFLRHGGLRLTLSGARLEAGALTAQVCITPEEEQS
jgi:methionyl-tRNA formyltransferase